MNHSNLTKKFQCYFEGLLKSEAVRELVTLIVKDCVTCQPSNIIFLKLFDRHATYIATY